MNQLITLKALLKHSDAQTDNSIFRLHYKATTTFLIACSLLVTATQFFGDPIHCVSQDVVSHDIMNSYCWVEGTITLPRSLNASIGFKVAAPGVDQRRINDNDEVIEHTYYQWVCFFLFFQGCMFYFPRWLWRLWEDGVIKKLTVELKNPILPEDKKDEQIKTLSEFMRDHQYINNDYALRHFFCECLNLVNVIGQIYFVDWFLGYQFRNYGPETIRYMMEDPEGRVDPMARVFPKVTKCRLKRFGTSGEVQNHDAICVLALNILNEKIFVILWFWFVILATVTAIGIIHRVCSMRVRRWRSIVLSRMAKIVDEEDLNDMLMKSTYGEWFVLSLIKDNVKSVHFKDIVKEVSCSRGYSKQKDDSEA